MSDSVLIIGGLGYLGSVLAPYLRKQGFTCDVADIGFFADCRIDDQDTEPFMKIDARSVDTDLIKRYDTVVLFAGISNDPVNNLPKDLVYEPTQKYAQNIAQICKTLGTKFIFASSCSVYGVGQENYLSESSSCLPQTPYSENKLLIEHDLAPLADQDFHPIALRFATVFGYSPRFRLDLFINMFTAMAHAFGEITLNSNGLAWRPSLHIKDMCKSILCAIHHKPQTTGLTVVNVGDNNLNMQVIDTAETIAALTHTKIKMLKPKTQAKATDLIADRKIKNGHDTRTYKVCFDKIHEVFPDFRCDFDLKAGVNDTLTHLDQIGFSKSDFDNINYYRLQKLENLRNQDLITDHITWSQSMPSHL